MKDHRPTRSSKTVTDVIALAGTATLLACALIGSGLAQQDRAAGITSTQEKMGKDGAPMVLVPAGAFAMGSLTGHEDERPPHRVYLDAFYIDQFEVTVSRYEKFLERENPGRPFLWNQTKRARDGQRPVIGVDWFDAAEYCQWAGKRLPTEAEWEKAARGPDERIYPWGNEAPTSAYANFGQDQWKGYETVVKVGSYPRGKSPYGVYDLAGNVWEWVADRYDQAYYQTSPDRNPAGPTAGPFRVLRGGAWNSDATIIRATNRGGYAPNARRSDFGFRCAQDAPP